MNRELSYQLSDDDLLHVLGTKDTRIVPYSEIHQYKTLDDLFGKDNRLIILYISSVDGNTTSGHWTCLSRVHRNGKNIIEFNDSYSHMPDEALKFIPKSIKKQTYQDKNYLTKLLYDYSLIPGNEIHYNEEKMQRMGEDISTCGRHIMNRLYFYKVPLEKYQKLFEQLKGKNIDLDKASVYISNYLMNKSHNN